VAALRNIQLDVLEFAIRGYFDRRGGRLEEIPNRGFDEIRYEIRIESAEPSARIKELVEEAERHCYVLSTLKRAAKISARATHNGVLLMEMEHRPE
jgi:uncharacterized OsmC-like protein